MRLDPSRGNRGGRAGRGREGPETVRGGPRLRSHTALPSLHRPRGLRQAEEPLSALRLVSLSAG